MVKQKRISVRISIEDFQFLKSRRLNLSQIIRSAIRYYRYNSEYTNVRNQLRRCSLLKPSNQILKITGKVQSGIPLIIAQRLERKNNSITRKYEEKGDR